MRAWTWWVLVTAVVGAVGLASAQQPPPSSYMPVVITESFATIMARMKAAKPEVERRQLSLLFDRISSGVMAASRSHVRPEGNLARADAPGEGRSGSLPPGALRALIVLSSGPGTFGRQM